MLIKKLEKAGTLNLRHPANEETGMDKEGVKAVRMAVVIWAEEAIINFCCVATSP